jgi:hypothetical protein
MKRMVLTVCIDTAPRLSPPLNPVFSMSPVHNTYEVPDDPLSIDIRNVERTIPAASLLEHHDRYTAYRDLLLAQAKWLVVTEDSISDALTKRITAAATGIGGPNISTTSPLHVRITCPTGQHRSQTLAQALAVNLLQSSDPWMHDLMIRLYLSNQKG